MNIVYESYKPRSILNTHKHVDGGWFWDKYSAFPYMGCFYGCEYCYWRDEKYNRLSREKPELSDAFSQYVKIKENAVELLKKELKNKPKEVIYIDSYQPIESKHRLARKLLEACHKLSFPVFINEKSPLLLNDLDILKKLDSINVGWSIAFSSDNEAKSIFESRSPSIESRFSAMRELSNAGIMTGTVAMPLLPFICDNEDNIKELVKKTRDNGGKYVLDAGLTLWGYCRTHYYKFLKQYDPKLIPKYDKAYDAKGNYLSYKSTYELVKEYCNRYNLPNHIPRPISSYPKELQFNKLVAEHFYLKSREVMVTEGFGYKQFACLRAAWIIDELNYSIKGLSKQELMKINGIGDKTSDEITNLNASRQPFHNNC